MILYEVPLNFDIRDCTTKLQHNFIDVSVIFRLEKSIYMPIERFHEELVKAYQNSIENCSFTCPICGSKLIGVWCSYKREVKYILSNDDSIYENFSRDYNASIKIQRLICYVCANIKYSPSNLKEKVLVEKKLKGRRKKGTPYTHALIPTILAPGYRYSVLSMANIACVLNTIEKVQGKEMEYKGSLDLRTVKYFKSLVIRLFMKYKNKLAIYNAFIKSQDNRDFNIYSLFKLPMRLNI